MVVFRRRYSCYLCFCAILLFSNVRRKRSRRITRTSKPDQCPGHPTRLLIIYPSHTLPISSQGLIHAITSFLPAPSLNTCFPSPQRVTHSVLCTRVLLRIFNSAHNPERTITFTDPSLVFSNVASTATTTAHSGSADSENSLAFARIGSDGTVASNCTATGLTTSTATDVDSARVCRQSRISWTRTGSELESVTSTNSQIWEVRSSFSVDRH